MTGGGNWRDERDNRVGEERERRRRRDNDSRWEHERRYLGRDERRKIGGHRHREDQE